MKEASDAPSRLGRAESTVLRSDSVQPCDPFIQSVTQHSVMERGSLFFAMEVAIQGWIRIGFSGSGRSISDAVLRIGRGLTAMLGFFRRGGGFAFALASFAHGGLVLYYPFESARTFGSGSPQTVTYDDLVTGLDATSSNSSHTGTAGAGQVGYSTNTVYASGQAGNVFEVASYVGAVHKGLGSGLTIAFWLRGSTLNKGSSLYGEGSLVDNNSCFMLGTDTTTGNKFRLYFCDRNGGVVLNRVSNSTIQNSSSPWYNSNNQWHHVVWTDNGGDAKLYVDGVQDSADFRYTAPAANLVSNFNTTSILGLRKQAGLTAYWGHSGGAADDFAVWNVALPASSVMELYTGAKTPLTVATAEPLQDVALSSLKISHRDGLIPQVDVEWRDDTLKWTLETSRNLRDWAFVDVANYTSPQPDSFKVTEDARDRDFYRLRKVGSTGIYVVGDSISTPGAWPINLAALTGKHIFSQAIGGTTSPSMVHRMRGVELAYPLTNPSVPGVVHMKWHRHIADRTHDAVNHKTKDDRAYYSKAVSEPTGIEVYQGGRYVGAARRSLRKFTTNYAVSSKTIFCPGHGLASGDRVAFISNDPAYPSNLSVADAAGAALPWKFSSAFLPSAIVERRVYFVANATTETFEVKELAGDVATLDIGSDSSGEPSIECGWSYDLAFAGGTWDVTWISRTIHDEKIWLLEVSANDIPMFSATSVTIPNNLLLIKQMIEINPRVLIVCPTSGSFTDRGPGSFNWTNYYDTYLPWVKANFPDNHIDTMAIFDANRSVEEKALLTNPSTPEKLWLVTSGTPGNKASWVVYRVATIGARETWIGPGYIPLHLRSSFGDDIHPNGTGNQIIANAVAAKLTAKGW